MDYSKLTDEELQRVIAERLGWRVVEREGLWMVLTPSHKDENLDAYLLREPESWRRFAKSTQDAAWEDIRRSLSRWLTSVDAAIMLIVENSPGLAYLEMKIGAFSEALLMPTEYAVGTLVKEGGNKAQMLARAICLAWLAWKDAQG